MIWTVTLLGFGLLILAVLIGGAGVTAAEVLRLLGGIRG
jgi:hypothetical protein